MRNLGLIFFLFFCLSCDLSPPNEKTIDNKGYYGLEEYWTIEETKGDTLFFIKSCDVCVTHIIPELGFNIIMGFDKKNLHVLIREFADDNNTFTIPTYFSTEVSHLTPKHLQTKDLIYRINTNRFEFLEKTESKLILKKIKYKPQ